MPPALNIIVNPRAGDGKAIRCLPKIRSVLEANATDYVLHYSSSLEDARSVAAIAATEGALIGVVGGDGTIGAVAAAVAQAKPMGDGLIGVIPAGRGNDCARTYGIPLDAAAAAHTLIFGSTRLMDLMAITGADGVTKLVAGSVYFGIAAAAGESANKARLIRGSMVYHISALRALVRWAPVLFKVDNINCTPSVDHVIRPQEFRGYGLVVANFPYFGAGMKIAPKADPSDGMLEIVLMREASKLTFLRVLRKVKNGTHLDLDHVRTGRASGITVTIDRQSPSGADGEILEGSFPLEIQVVPSALRIVVPRPDDRSGY